MAESGDDFSNSVTEQQQVCGLNIETFRKQFLCSQCNDFFKEPQSLSCFESFCCAVRKNVDQNRERQGEEDIGENRSFSQEDGGENEIISSMEIGYGNEEINDDHLICSCGKNSGDRHFLQDARLLPCLHPFCDECLRKEITKQGNGLEECSTDRFQSFTGSADEIDNRKDNEAVSFTCPVDGCGRSTGILIYGNDRIEWSRELRNSSLQNMVTSMCFKKRLLKHEQLCDACPDNFAVAVCIDESDFDLPLCQDCLTRHQSARSTSKHNVIRIDELSNGSVIEGIPKSLHHRAPFCRIHHDQRICMYCPVHSTVVCLKCACTATDVGGHEQCRGKFDVEVHPDECQGRQYRQKFEETVEKMKTLRNELEDAIRNVEVMKKSLDVCHTVVLKEINNRCKTLQQKLEERRDEVANQVDEIYNFKKLELNSHLEMLKEVKISIGESLDWITEFTKAAIPADFYSLKKHMENRMNSLISRYQPYMRGGPSKHPDVFLANDVIHYDFNDEMLIENSVGEVYSTPCLRNFSILEDWPVRLICKDIVGTHLYNDLPNLEANLIPYELSNQSDIEMGGGMCTVILHPEHGIYMFSVDADIRPGRYYLRISHPNPPTYFSYEKHGKIIKLEFNYEEGRFSVVH